MTIETKKAANVKEALEILNSLLPNGFFEYYTENYSGDYKTTNRFFRATAENGATCYGMIEFVENGTLVKVRFVNTYEENAVDIEIENFTSGVANVEDNAKMTIETKGARNGSLIVKVNGKRAKFYEAASLIGNLRNPNLEIRTDRNVTYTQTCIEKCHAVYFKDSTGNLYKFDYFFSETTLRNIANGNLHNNLYKTAAEREEILSTPLVTIEAQDAATNAEIDLASPARNRFYKEDENGNLIQNSYEQMIDAEIEPLVTIEAQDAAIDAEIELATDYQPQTNWENPHDFTIVGDLSDRNINSRIAAFNHKEEVTLTDNMKLAKQITDKLGSLLVKFSHANEGNNGGLALHYETFKDEHDEFGTLTRVVEVFTDQTNFILDHVNFITGYGVDKKIEQFFFTHDKPFQPPTRKQIVESLNRAIDKAKFNVQIARVSGNQVQANFERELYLIAAKALHELKH